MQHLSKNVQHEYGAFQGIEDPVDAVEDDMMMMTIPSSGARVWQRSNFLLDLVYHNAEDYKKRNRREETRSQQS